jgi:hypothetical protein
VFKRETLRTEMRYIGLFVGGKHTWKRGWDVQGECLSTNSFTPEVPATQAQYTARNILRWTHSQYSLLYGRMSYIFFLQKAFRFAHLENSPYISY